MIREAAPGDRPRLLALQAELASPWPDLLELAVGGDGAGDGPVALVACAGDPTDSGPAGLPRGSPVGYLLAVPGGPADERGTRRSDDDGTAGTADPGSVYLAEVVVAPDHRREGHGRGLIEAAAARFAGYDQLRLTARADDEGALAFYRACGFRVVEELPGHYDEAGGTGDGLLLARDLRQ